MNLAACAIGSLLACSLLLHHHQSMDSTTTEEVEVFEQGRHHVSLHRVAEARRRCSPAGAGAGKDKDKENLPPKPLLVAAPREAGEYPVLLFFHGYLVVNSFYSQMHHHVASHGFIVVGPQMYTVSGPDTTDEINGAAAVIDWLAGGLPSVLPPGVRANLTKVSIAGHSRGGKVAFALALGHAKFSPKLTALVAVDPVDGMGMGRQTPPPILTGTNASLRVPAPVMVVGTGLGELHNGPLLPPCAPRGVSHAAFYDECAARAGKCHLVARDYGHTDMMDDDTGGARGILTRALCRSGGARAPMRRFVAGATVAFLSKVTRGDGAALGRIRARPETAPVALSVVHFDDE